MQKTPLADGTITFICRCLQTAEGTADDSLMAEEYLEANMLTSKHDVFIENSAHDPAANIVLVDCPQCGLDFMIQIMTGDDQITMYTCSCGYKTTRQEYMRSKTTQATTAESAKDTQ